MILLGLPWAACNRKSNKPVVHTGSSAHLPDKIPLAQIDQALTEDHADKLLALITKYNLPADTQIDEDRNTWLMVASSRNAHQCVKALLDHGASPYALNASRTTAVVLAIRADALEVLEMFRSVIDRDRIVLSDGWTLLHEAAAGSSGATVAAVLGFGFDVNARTTDGQTPLIAAAIAGSSEAVEQLIRANADVRAVDINNKAAQEYAISRRNRSPSPDIEKMVLLLSR